MLPSKKADSKKAILEIIKNVEPSLALQLLLSNIEGPNKFKDTMYVIGELQYKDLILEKCQVLDDAEQLKILTQLREEGFLV